MSSSDGPDVIEVLVRNGAGAGRRVTRGATWLMVTPDGLAAVEHGWKLHVSSRSATFPDLVETILPVLAAEGCAFKLARSCRVLAELNDGLTSPATVGKAVTIYPDQHRVRELALTLAALLAGRPGPRILSDRQVTRSAPVYYRYGAFEAAWESGERGRLTLVLHGPGGEVFDGAADLVCRQPPWAADPFTGAIGDGGSPAGPQILGGHYEVTAGLRQAAWGNVYAGVDGRDGAAVVIKQARALVSEDRQQADTRLRLRNERRVLQALDGVAGVPRFVDHFRHADDEFLVISDCGPANLIEDVLGHGAYRTGPGGPRSLGTLAAGLARILSQVHQRGVIMRDLSPKNVVISETGEPSIIDFGIAAYDGLHLDGATPGYAPARQRRAEPPEVADDYFALGMTLLFAATALDPVTAGDDPALPRHRALQAITAVYGASPPVIIGMAADLIGSSGQAAAGAFGYLVSGESGCRPASAGSLPATPVLTADIAAEVAGSLLDDLVRQAEQLLDTPPGQRAAHDASIYQGSAGIGLELLHHMSDSRAVHLLADLAAFTAQAAERAKLAPGLIIGTTGVEIFLRQAAASGVAVPRAAASAPGPDWQPDGDDLMVGAAGVGLGELWLSRSGDPAQLAAAVRCGHGILSGTTPATPAGDGSKLVAGLDPAAGRAHGLAGVTEFLLTLTARTGDENVLAAAAERAGQLARRTRPLIRHTTQLTAAPMAVSWCQGLAGIGPVLALAGTVLADTAMTTLAGEAADACIAYLPRIGTAGRCCGAAGVGTFLLDLAAAGQDERYWQAAERVGSQILLRSAGTPSHPVFAASSDDTSVGWAFGLAGLLPLFRRLANRGGSDSLPWY
ncbi:MAG TPA: class IV lanthionine synthetase LanL [Streptosporangiaceae bacterium]|nr:class IV lanthionine synthetase LanL [Streptosporangiaceae bacterium]